MVLAFWSGVFSSKVSFISITCSSSCPGAVGQHWEFLAVSDGGQAVLGPEPRPAPLISTPAFLWNLPTAQRCRGPRRRRLDWPRIGSGPSSQRPSCSSTFSFETNTCTHTSALTSSLPLRLKFPTLLAFPPYLLCLCSHSDPLNYNLPFFPGTISCLPAGFFRRILAVRPTRTNSSSAPTGPFSSMGDSNKVATPLPLSSWAFSCRTHM